MLGRQSLKGGMIDSDQVGATSGDQEVLYVEITFSWSLSDRHRVISGKYYSEERPQEKTLRNQTIHMAGAHWSREGMWSRWGQRTGQGQACSTEEQMRIRGKRKNQSDKVAKATFEHMWLQISAVYLDTCETLCKSLSFSELQFWSVERK